VTEEMGRDGASHRQVSCHPREVAAQHLDDIPLASATGSCLLGQNKFAEAEPLLLQGYEGMKQREKTTPPEVAPRIPEDRLILLATTTGKPDEAKKWCSERAKDCEAKPAEKK
jgi:hypothetical protein